MLSNTRVALALALVVAAAVPCARAGAVDWTLSTQSSGFPKFAYRVAGAGVDNVDNPTLTVNVGDVVTVWHDALSVDQSACVNTAPSVSGAERGPVYPNVEPYGTRSEWHLRCLSGKGRHVLTFPAATAGTTLYLVAAAYTDPAHPPFVTIRVRPASAIASAASPTAAKPPMRFRLASPNANARASAHAKLSAQLKRARARRARAHA